MTQELTFVFQIVEIFCVPIRFCVASYANWFSVPGYFKDVNILAPPVIKSSIN